MKMKIKRAFTENVGLKILALLFSLFLWLIVVNVDDPETTHTYTTAVSIINPEVITDDAKYFEILGSNTVSFRVKGKRSFMEKISPSDFSAVADMNYLEQDEYGSYRVPVEITANKYANNLEISSKQLYIKINVEEEASNRFIIEGFAVGTPSLGYAVEKIDVNPNVVTVTGPADEVARIASVKALCDVNDLTTDVNESVVPVFFDADGNTIDTKNMKLSVSTVDVTINMVNVKDVSISVETTGELAEGLTLGGITCTPGSLSIKGEPNAVNKVSSIVIPAGVIDLATISTSYSTTVDITAYLPSGVSLVDSSQSMVTVLVTLVGQESTTFEMPVKNININGLASGLEAKYASDKVAVNISGSAEDIAAIKASDITGYIDATGLEAGSHTVSLTIALDARYTVSPVTVTVELIDPKAAETPAEGGAGSDTPATDADKDNKDNKDNKDKTSTAN